MTEVGMALSNPLKGDRRPGFVGVPLPGVEVKVVAEDGSASVDGPGELRVKGLAVFKEVRRAPLISSVTTSEKWTPPLYSSRATASGVLIRSRPLLTEACFTLRSTSGGKRRRRSPSTRRATSRRCTDSSYQPLIRLQQRLDGAALTLSHPARAFPRALPPAGRHGHP